MKRLYSLNPLKWTKKSQGVYCCQTPLGEYTCINGNGWAWILMSGNSLLGTGSARYKPEAKEQVRRDILRRLRPLLKAEGVECDFNK